MHRPITLTASLVVLLLLLTLAGHEQAIVADTNAAAVGQAAATDAGPATSAAPESADEAVPMLGNDALAPYPLNQVVDIDLQNVPISDVAKWIHDEFDVPVTIDERDNEDNWQARARFNVSGQQQRLYTILQRGLQNELTGDWSIQCVVRDGAFVLGEESYLLDEYRVASYDVADLLDRGFDLKVLQDFLREFTSGEWYEVDGIGGKIEHVRGVLIVRQSDRVHEELTHLLAVLRQPRTAVVRLHDLEDNRLCRLRLQEPVTLSLNEVPFDQAIAQLSKAIGVPMRVHSTSLADSGYGTDLPVSLEADALIAGDALDALLADYDASLGEDAALEFFIENGEIVISTEDDCVDRMGSRLYDVPYFAQSPEMQSAFKQMLMNYTSGEWREIDGVGGEIFVIEPDWIVIRNTARVFDEIDELLAQWREIGLTDAARDRFPAFEVEPDPLTQPSTSAYVMHVDTATDLLEVLPERVSPGTWQDADHPDAVGKIRMVRLGMVDYTPAPQVESDDASANVEVVAADNEEAPPIQFPAAMLIIEHQSGILAEVRSEIDDLRAESWTTDGGEIRPHTPIERVPFGEMSSYAGSGFFQIP